MNLYFNGCSLTAGDELSAPETEAWPALVADSLSATFLNDAALGGANDRIIYKTVPNVNNYDYFFIAWTFYSRFTEYNPIDNFEVSFNPQLILDPSMHYYVNYVNYGKLYYQQWFNELYAFKKWLHQIILLQSFFEKHKKKYTMLNAADNHLMLWLQPADKFITTTRHLIDFFDRANDDQLLEEHYQIQQLVSLIDTSAFIDWARWNINSLSACFERGPRGHILKAGHQEVANKVLKHYYKTS